jgi:uncharacterized protein
MKRTSESSLASRTTVPIRQFVLKLTGRCNLACDYCYVYTMADQSWRSRPGFIDRATVHVAARRIGEHAAAHGVDAITVILHGGEPLLIGPVRLGEVAEILRAAMPRGVALDLRMQTNGVLLDERILRALGAHGIRAGLSVDGGERHHDRHRRDRGGRGSHAGAVQAARMLAGSDLFAGVLCVIDLENDPVEVYEALLELAPPAIDFLLPHGNWSAPPPGRDRGDARTPYADWLTAVFDRWYGARRQEAGVRLFQEIINLILGGRSRTSQVGLSPTSYLVIDTDGSFQQTDILKSVLPGAPETGMTVFDQSVDQVLCHPEVTARQSGMAALADGCRDCAVVKVCGGGNYAHRFENGAGFRNPSVYCADLERLIRHVHGRVRSDLLARVAP